jgi:hypothetical protein
MDYLASCRALSLRLFYVGFVVDHVVLGQVFSLNTSLFPCHYYSAKAPYLLIYHLPCMILATESVVK